MQACSMLELLSLNHFSASRMDRSSMKITYTWSKGECGVGLTWESRFIAFK